MAEAEYASGVPSVPRILKNLFTDVYSTYSVDIS